jgi:ketosteroid isomerase-like protein
MIILETDDTALILSQTFLSAEKKQDSEYSMERKATYVFKKNSSGEWLCAIDNSYGTDLLDVEKK